MVLSEEKRDSRKWEVNMLYSRYLLSLNDPLKFLVKNSAFNVVIYQLYFQFFSIFLRTIFFEAFIFNFSIWPFVYTTLLKFFIKNSVLILVIYQFYYRFFSFFYSISFEAFIFNFSMY